MYRDNDAAIKGKYIILTRDCFSESASADLDISVKAEFFKALGILFSFLFFVY